MLCLKGEVEHCELAVMFFGGAVVGFCRFDFVGERAEIYPSAVDPDARPPAFHVDCPVDSLVF